MDTSKLIWVVTLTFLFTFISLGVGAFLGGAFKHQGFIKEDQIAEYCKDKKCFGKQKIAEMVCHFDEQGEEQCLRVNTYEKQFGEFNE